MPLVKRRWLVVLEAIYHVYKDVAMGSSNWGSAGVYIAGSQPMHAKIFVVLAENIFICFLCPKIYLQ